MAKKSTLPKEFKQYFWDVDFKKLSLDKNRDFILSRVMNYGNMPAIKWLFNGVRENTMKRFVASHGDRQLDKRSNNFWRLYFHLPPSKAKSWQER